MQETYQVFEIYIQSFSYFKIETHCGTFSQISKTRDKSDSFLFATVLEVKLLVPV